MQTILLLGQSWVTGSVAIMNGVLKMTFSTIMALLSGITWTGTYIVLIYRGFKDKATGMPLIALGLNISWEFLYSFIFPSDNKIQLVINIVWFLFDVVIIVQKFMYGRDEYDVNLKGLGKNLFYPTLMVSLLVCFLAVYFAAIEWKDYIGLYSAFIMNLLMSVSFISMLAKREDIKGQSIYVAVLKLIGTLAPTLVLCSSHPLVFMLGAGCFFYDSVYTILLVKKYKQLGLSVFSRKPIVLSANAARVS